MSNNNSYETYTNTPNSNGRRSRRVEVHHHHHYITSTPQPGPHAQPPAPYSPYGPQSHALAPYHAPVPTYDNSALVYQVSSYYTGAWRPVPSYGPYAGVGYNLYQHAPLPMAAPVVTQAPARQDLRQYAPPPRTAPVVAQAPGLPALRQYAPPPRTAPVVAQAPGLQDLRQYAAPPRTAPVVAQAPGLQDSRQYAPVPTAASVTSHQAPGRGPRRRRPRAQHQQPRADQQSNALQPAATLSTQTVSSSGVLVPQTQPTHVTRSDSAESVEEMVRHWMPFPHNLPVANDGHDGTVGVPDTDEGDNNQAGPSSSARGGPQPSDNASLPGSTGEDYPSNESEPADEGDAESDADWQGDTSVGCEEGSICDACVLPTSRPEGVEQLSCHCAIINEGEDGWRPFPGCHLHMDISERLDMTAQDIAYFDELCTFVAVDTYMAVFRHLALRRVDASIPPPTEAGVLDVVRWCDRHT